MLNSPVAPGIVTLRPYTQPAEESPAEFGLEDTIKSYRSVYTGNMTTAALAACQYIARVLDDTFDATTSSCTRRDAYPADYFGIIADELSSAETRALVAAGDAWKVFGADEYLGNMPLTVYHTPRVMVFADVDVTTANKTIAYLARDLSLLSFAATSVGVDMPRSRIERLEYLFPVTGRTIGRYTQFSTTYLSELQIHHLVQYDDTVFVMPRLDDRKATFAAYLLSESLFFEQVLDWRTDLSALVLSHVGWIQALDIWQRFGAILAQIDEAQVAYADVGTYEDAVASGDKCFLFLGMYVAARVNDAPESRVSRVPVESPIASRPLRAVYTQGARDYFASLGYSTSMPFSLKPSLQGTFFNPADSLLARAYPDL